LFSLIFGLLSSNLIVRSEHDDMVDAIIEQHNKDVVDLRSQINNANKQLAVANAKAEHLQAAVDNLRGELSVSNGSRDRAHIKISAAMKALQS